jgi:hypothetical protein|tara:strand:- start:468 stop:791 length:324 start_codon:yes stop_codon:yes gene_type:complete
MGIISPLLQHSATRSSLQGMSAYGEVFDTSESIKCRIEPQSKRVSTEEANEVLASAKMYAEKDQTLEVGDKIIFDSVTYFVLQVNKIYGLSNVSHIEADLGVDTTSG